MRTSHWRRALPVVLAIIAGGTLAACNAAVEPPSEPQVFRRHQFLTAGPGVTKLALGESCLTYGSAGCESNMCVHTKSRPSEGWICSTGCSSARDCPEHWRCRQVVPGRGGSFCIPPDDWTPQAVLARSAVSTGGAP